MGLHTLVKDSVDLAFNLLGDLASDFTFTKVTNAGFSFSTGENTTPTETNLSLRGVLFTAKRAFPEHNSTMTKVIVKTKDVGDITSFDFFTHNATKYNIGPIITNDGFVIEFEALKEV